MDIRIVDGRLTKDAEVRLNKTNGTKFLSFTIANNGFAKGVQTTTYFNVISYNEFDINRAESLTKGKLVVVSGRPNENISVKDDKTYLNRNIMAHNIESGTLAQSKETPTSNQVETIQSVGAPQIKVETPQVPLYEASIGNNMKNSNNTYQGATNTEIPKVTDDLPF